MKLDSDIYYQFYRFSGEKDFTFSVIKSNISWEDFREAASTRNENFWEQDPKNADWAEIESI